MKTTIIYWSSTGNTEKMANLIQQGILESGADIEVVFKAVGDSSEKDITESDVVLLGCSAMGVEEIDTSEMEPFITKNKEAFYNKSIGLFGSYGWGDGEWMESFEGMMNLLGAKIMVDNLMVNELPEGASELECIEFGKRVSRIPKGV